MAIAMENLFGAYLLAVLNVLFSVLILYWVFKKVSGIIFKPLTAHWFAVGISISYGFGHLLFSMLVHIEVIKLSPEAIEFTVSRFLGAWLLGLIPLNIIVLPLLYWRDKRVAMKQSNSALRIPENALHALAFCGGYLGSWIGQTQFKHKISKDSFKKKHYVVCLFSFISYAIAAYYFFRT